MELIVEFIKVIVLGIVEGFTEWLPVSSTGHMILLEHFLELDVSEEFWNMFIVVIQLGAILAVTLMYWNKLNPFDKKKDIYKRQEIWLLWTKIVVACLPSSLIGFFLDEWMDEHLYNGLIVSVTLVLYGLLFILIEDFNKKRQPVINNTNSVSYLTALYIGAFQVLALVPGTSRSGVTILGAMILGCSRSVSAEFSFFLGIPTMLGASLLKLVKFGLEYEGLEFFYLILGMVVAFFVSVYVIKFLLMWVKKYDFKIFGYYRIVLGIVVFIWFIISSLVGD